MKYQLTITMDMIGSRSFYNIGNQERTSVDHSLPLFIWFGNISILDRQLTTNLHEHEYTG